MADGRKAGTSGGRCVYKRRAKKTKPIEVVLSDSSSDSNDDNEPPVSLPSTVPPSKSMVDPPPPPENSTMECPVCLQPCIHPARLPCGHIFCFLCLKGIAQQCRRCAMCRQEISPDYLDRPDLLQVPESQNEKEADTFEDGYQWFYEGRNGWWKFDERLSHDLEEVHRLGLNSLETLICGTLYILDLQELVQYNKETPWRRRKIKRDLAANVVVKGWWQYDERTSRDLETSYKTGTRTCELLIAGFLYTADFDEMVQSRRNEPHRRRRIKRDLATIPKKGVAGIRIAVNVDCVLDQLSSLSLSDAPADPE